MKVTITLEDFELEYLRDLLTMQIWKDDNEQTRASKTRTLNKLQKPAK